MNPIRMVWAFINSWLLNNDNMHRLVGEFNQASMGKNNNVQRKNYYEIQHNRLKDKSNDT